MRAGRGAAILGAMGLLALSGPALAAHGKAGLWDLTVSVTAPGMDKPQTVSTKHCMTAAEVASPTLSAPAGSNCTMQNAKSQGGTFSGDLVCTGQQKGNGHMAVTYDSPTHYTGKMTFTGESEDGSPVTMTQNMEGRWTAADCGNVSN